MVTRKNTIKQEEKNTTKEQISLYGTISPLLQHAFSEVKEFSKKKQEEQLNLNKVKTINRLLEKAKELLKNEPTNEFLDLLNEDDLPSNSDAVLTMSQFIAAMNKFHTDHYHLNGWDIDGGGDWD